MIRVEGEEHQTPPLELWRSIASLLPSPPLNVPRTGPRWWWGGPLDVEGLALGSVEAFAKALGALDPSADSAKFALDASVVAASFGSFSHLRIDGTPCVGFASLSGFHRTADGWVRLHANYPHHEQALLDALGVRTAEGVRQELTRRTSADIEAAVYAQGGLAAEVRKPDEWLASPSAAALNDTAWIEWETSEGVPIRPHVGGEGRRPLEGVRVLDLTRVIAGPSASRLLGALGADVLRLDPPDIPELWDHHVDTGFDKRSAVADLRDRTTRERAHSLLNEADAVMLGYRWEGLQRLGFDAVSLRERHPHLAVVSLDAWGTKGPYAGQRGFDSIVQAATGIAHLYGQGEGDEWKPGSLPVQALDHATGLGMGAALLALIRVRAQGRSGHAHLSLARTALELLKAAPPSGPPAPLEKVDLRRSVSSYGSLEFVPPPLTIDGTQLEFTSMPQRYGTSMMTWR
ncbi:CoA transferase [Kytococcus sp. Marseille-QA3725]